MERRIARDEVINTIENPETIFIDTLTGNFVAVAKSDVVKNHRIIVIYSSVGEKLKIITVIETSKGEEFIGKREKKGRWKRL